MSSNFGHVQRTTKQVGGRIITFRSLLEYRYAVYLQLQKDQGFIVDWHYEDAPLHLTERYFNNKRRYWPDFFVEVKKGKYELHECKGWFSAKDYTKIKLAAEQYSEFPITVIFADLADTKSKRRQHMRAKRLEPHVKRIIYDADKTIFKPISFLL